MNIFKKKELFGNFLELRSVTISYAKGKAKETTKREHAIKDELEKLDHI